MVVSTKYSSAPVERFRLFSESETNCKVSAAECINNQLLKLKQWILGNAISLMNRSIPDCVVEQVRSE